MSKSTESTTETTQTTPDTEPSSSTTKQSSSSPKLAIGLAAIAIALTLGLTGGLYWHGHQAIHSLQQREQDLTAQLNQDFESKLQSQLKQNSAAVQGELSRVLSQLKAEQAQSQALKQQIKAATERNKTIEERLAQLDVGELNQWRLFEAQYLIHLSGRKLWLEQDLAAAKSLLESANKSIAQLNDPQLLPLRRAIVDDINQIDTIDNVDLDGVALQLDSLIDQVGELTLADVQLPAAVESDNEQADGTLANWRANLAKSWRHFTEDFVTVRRRDGQVEALIEPKHTWYLQENIKLALQKAQLAAAQQKPEKFEGNLRRAYNWIAQYFEANTTAKHLLSSLDKLMKQSVLTPLPESLSSIKLIDSTIKDKAQSYSSEGQK